MQEAGGTLVCLTSDTIVVKFMAEKAMVYTIKGLDITKSIIVTSGVFFSLSRLGVNSFSSSSSYVAQE